MQDLENPSDSQTLKIEATGNALVGVSQAARHNAVNTGNAQVTNNSQLSSTNQSK